MRQAYEEKTQTAPYHNEGVAPHHGPARQRCADLGAVVDAPHGTAERNHDAYGCGYLLRGQPVLQTVFVQVAGPEESGA